MNIKLVKCAPEDSKTLAALARKTFADAFESQNNADDFSNYLNQAFSEEQILKELRQQGTHYFWIYFQSKIAGFLKLNEAGYQSDINDPKSLELERIYVVKEFQGRQIGGELLTFVKKMAEKLNKSYIWLGVWEKNPDAIRFYEKHGFITFGTHPYPIGSDLQTDLLMRFDLN